MFLFILPSVVSCTHKESEFFGIFTKELIGKFPQCLENQKYKPLFETLIALTKSGLEKLNKLNSNPTESQISDNLKKSSTLQDPKFKKFSNYLKSKLKRLKKESKEKKILLNALVFRLFENLTRKVSNFIGTQQDFQDGHLIKFLNKMASFFPFGHWQAQALLTLVEPKAKSQAKTAEAQEARKLCEVYMYSLKKKLEDQNLWSGNKLRKILGKPVDDSEISASRKSQSEEKDNPVEKMDREMRRLGRDSRERHGVFGRENRGARGFRRDREYERFRGMESDGDRRVDRRLRDRERDRDRMRRSGREMRRGDFGGYRDAKIGFSKKKDDHEELKRDLSPRDRSVDGSRELKRDRDKRNRGKKQREKDKVKDSEYVQLSKRSDQEFKDRDSRGNKIYIFIFYFLIAY